MPPSTAAAESPEQVFEDGGASLVGLEDVEVQEVEFVRVGHSITTGRGWDQAITRTLNVPDAGSIAPVVTFDARTVTVVPPDVTKAL